MKSDAVKKGIERASHRSLLYALGCTREEMDKPFIGVVNSYTEIVPGHIHLNDIAESVIPEAGFPFRIIPWGSRVTAHWKRLRGAICRLIRSER